MTREEFMDIVYSELHSDGDNYRANRIIDAADEYAEAQTIWIPISEGLPEPNVWVWVTVDRDGIRRPEIMRRHKYIVDAWTNGIHSYATDEIAAWMPLSIPEPYKMKEGK